MIMLRRSKSIEITRSMIAEIIFIETAPAKLHPFVFTSFVSGLGGTRREDILNKKGKKEETN
jgi:hypothetical protein